MGLGFRGHGSVKRSKTPPSRSPQVCLEFYRKAMAGARKHMLTRIQVAGFSQPRWIMADVNANIAASEVGGRTRPRAPGRAEPQGLRMRMRVWMQMWCEKERGCERECECEDGCWPFSSSWAEPAGPQC